MAIGIRDIAIADQYQGNAALGGSLDGVVQIDTRPIQQLATYSFYYNREKYQQQQKDAEDQAAKLADLTAYDLNTAIPKDRTLIQKQYDELYDYVQKNPTVLDYKNNQKGWLEYNKKKNDFTNNLRGAKTRTILYSSRLAEISAEKNPAKKKLMEDELNSEANSTDLKTPLTVTQQYDDSLPEMPKAVGLKVPVAIRNGNDIFDEEHEIWNGRQAQDQSNVFALGLDKVVDPNSPEGKRKDIAVKNNFWLQGADIFNSAVQSYKDANGNIDISKVKGVSRQLIDIADNLNAYSAKKKAEIQSGLYGNTLKVEDFPTVNYADGNLTPDELALMANYASWKGDNVSRKIVKTNDASEAANRALTARGQNLDYEVGMAKVKQDKAEMDSRERQYKAAQNGTSSQINGATEYAKRIYSDLQKLADDKGVISPDKLRKLNTEQLKYLGLEKPITDLRGTVTGAPILQPLKFDKNKEYALELVDGEVRVLAPKAGQTKLERTASGNFRGQFDNELSTNIFNIATNRLNEELTNAGTKELNSYWGLDVTNRPTSFTDNTSSQTTSSSTSSAQSQSTPAGKVKVEVNGKLYEVPESSLEAMDKDKVKYKRL